MNENLGFRPQLTAAATLLHLLADSLQCGTEEKCVLELRRISITLQDKKSLAALPDAQARPALGKAGCQGSPPGLQSLLQMAIPPRFPG